MVKQCNKRWSRHLAWVLGPVLALVFLWGSGFWGPAAHAQSGDSANIEIVKCSIPAYALLLELDNLGADEVDTQDFLQELCAEFVFNFGLDAQHGSYSYPGIAGSYMVWTIFVYNNEPLCPPEGECESNIAHNVVVYDNLPPGILKESVVLFSSILGGLDASGEGVDAENGPPFCTLFDTTIGTPGDPDDPLIWNVDDLSPQDAAFCTILGKIDPDYVNKYPGQFASFYTLFDFLAYLDFYALPLLINNTWVEATTQDPNIDDNRAHSYNNVVDLAELRIIKEVEPSPKFRNGERGDGPGCQNEGCDPPICDNEQCEPPGCLNSGCEGPPYTIIPPSEDFGYTVAGTEFTYSIYADNIGSSTAEQVKVTDKLPEGVEFVSAVVVGGTGHECAYDVGAHEVVCELGNLPTVSPYGLVSYILALIEADVGDILPADVEAAAHRGEIFGKPDQVQIIITVRAASWLADALDFDTILTSIGTAHWIDFIYEAIITNVAVIETETAELSEDLVRDFETGPNIDANDVEGEFGRGGCWDNVFEYLGPLGPDGGYGYGPFYYDLPMSKRQQHHYLCMGIFPNIAVAYTNVYPAVDLSIEKYSDPEKNIAGEQKRYEIDVYNYGPSDADNVFVFDVLPDEVAFEVENSEYMCTQPGNLIGLRAHLNGESEVDVASVDTEGTGLATFVVDTTVFSHTFDYLDYDSVDASLYMTPENAVRIYYAIQVNDILPPNQIVAAHLHAGNAGENGPVVITLYPPDTFWFEDFEPDTPLVATTVISKGLADAILADPAGYYVNVHTVNHPDGEIRGQLAQTENSPLRCDLGYLAADSSYHFDIWAQVDADVPAGASIRNVAMVFSETETPDLEAMQHIFDYFAPVSPSGGDYYGGPLLYFPPLEYFSGPLSDNVADAKNLILGEADLQVRKFGKPDDEVKSGGEVVYTVIVNNHGPSIAGNVIVDELLASDGTYSYVAPDFCTPSAGGPVSGNTEFSCELDDILAGEEVTFHITATVDGEQTLNNLADVRSDTPDPYVDNNQASTDHLVSEHKADLEITKIGTPESGVEISQSLDYTIIIKNHGPDTAKNVFVHELLASDGAYLYFGSDPLEYCMEAPPDPIEGNHEFGCPNLGDLGPGEQLVFNISVVGLTPQAIQNIADVTSDTYDPDPSNNQASTVHQISAFVPEADLVIRKFGKPDGVVQAGDSLDYTIVVANLGPDDAVGVSVLEHIASDGAYSFDAPDFCEPLVVDATAGNTLLDCILPVILEAGVQFIFPITVHAVADQSINNVADVKAVTFDPDMSNNHAIVEHEVSTVADLSIVKTASSDSAMAGGELTYMIMAGNGGPSTAENVVIHDHLPQGVEVLGVSFEAGDGSCVVHDEEQTITCGLGSLAATDGLVVVHVDVRVDPTVPNNSVLANSAVVSSDVFDNDNSNNYSSVLVSVENDLQSGLAIEKTVSALTPVAGERVSYHVTVTNLDSDVARNVVATDTLPAGVSYVVDAGAGVQVSEGVYRFGLGDLAPGASASFEIVVEVGADTECSSTLTNRASANANNRDEVSTAANVVVDCASDLRVLVLSQPQDETNVGDNNIFTFIIDNLGASFARNLELAIQLIADGGFEILSITSDRLGNQGGATCEPATGMSIDGNVLIICSNNAALGTLNTDAATVASLSELNAADVETGRWIVQVEIQSNSPVNVDVLATVASSDREVAPDDNVAIARQSIVCQSSTESTDISLTKELATPGPITANSTAIYRLTYNNYSVNPAYCVQVVENVPAHTTFNADESDEGWTCVDGAPAGVACIFNIGTVPGGGGGEILFAADVDDVDESVTITNTARINTTTTDDAEGNNEAVLGADVVTPTGLNRPDQPLDSKNWIYLPSISD